VGMVCGRSGGLWIEECGGVWETSRNGLIILEKKTSEYSVSSVHKTFFLYYRKRYDYTRQPHEI